MTQYVFGIRFNQHKPLPLDRHIIQHQKTALDRPEALLFDLGGVIVNWTGIDALMDLTGWSRETVLGRFKISDIFRAHEIGRCSDEDFITDLRHVFNLRLSHTETKAAWISWLGTPYPGVKAALKSLKTQYVTACLSNTNALHWAVLEREIAHEGYFDYYFASHIMHAAKPDSKSYNIPIQKMGISSRNIWFFDDTQANVDAAISIGMTAFYVDRKVGVIPTLLKLGLL